LSSDDAIELAKSVARTPATAVPEIDQQLTGSKTPGLDGTGTA
jgi:hypothetical protein